MVKKASDRNMNGRWIAPVNPPAKMLSLSKTYKPCNFFHSKGLDGLTRLYINGKLRLILVGNINYHLAGLIAQAI